MSVFIFSVVYMQTSFKVFEQNIVYADTTGDDKKDESSDKDKDKDKDDEDKDKDEEDDKKSDSSSDVNSTSESPWNKAIIDLASSSSFTKLIDDSEKDGSDDKKAERADLGVILSGGEDRNALNAWGFMGPENTGVWEKSTNASWSSSYDKLVNATAKVDNHAYDDKVVPVNNAYKQSARFAYVMQSLGLDKPVDTGLDGEDNTTPNKVLGNVMQIAYVVMDSMEGLFRLALDMLSKVTPISWAVHGTPGEGPFAGLAQLVREFYYWFHEIGIGFVGMIFAVTLALAAFGVTIGTGNNSRVGPTKAIVNTFVDLLKRFFIFVYLPIFGILMWQYTVDSAKTAFSATDSSVPNYAVFGAFVNYQQWVMNSRMALPSGINFQSSFSANNLTSLTHEDILKINRYGAGYKDLTTLGMTNNSDAINTKATNVNNSKLSNKAKHMLSSWASQDTMTAADYASAMDASIIKSLAAGARDDVDKLKNADISEELVKSTYNANATNYVTGSDSDSYFKNDSSREYNGVLEAKDPGGLSTLGMYVYLLAKADKNNIGITNTEKLSSKVTMPAHQSVILVGSGIEGTARLIWAFGMIVGLALLTIGYIWEVLKSFVLAIPSLSVATITTGLGSKRSAIRFVAILGGLMVGVFGSAVMFLIANMAFISISSAIDAGFRSFIVGSLNLFGTTSTSAGMLASGTTVRMSNSAFDIAYGVFLLWLAIQLLKARADVVAYFSSMIEETANKVLYTFGNLTGQGSTGTQGAISNNTNSSTSSTMMNTLGTAAKLGAMGAIGAGGASGLKDLMSNNNKSDIKNSSNSKEKENSKDSKDNTATKQLGANSSANKQGNAAQRLGLQGGISNGNGAHVSNLSNNKNDMHNGNTMPVMDDNGNQVGTMDQNEFNTNDSFDQGLNNQFDSNANDQNDKNSIGQDGNANNDMNQFTGDSTSQFGDTVNSNLTDSDNNSSLGDAGDNMLNNGDANNNSFMGSDENMSVNDNSTLGDNAVNNGDANSMLGNSDAFMNSGDTIGMNSNGDNVGLDNSSINQGQGDLSMNNFDAQRQEAYSNMIGNSMSDTHQGDGTVNSSFGDQNLGNSLMQNSANADVNGSNSANSNMFVPVDNSLSAMDVSSRMGDVRNASDVVNNANQMSSLNPSNKTLQSQALSATNSLKDAQSGAMNAYNSQPVSGDTLQSSWMGNNVDSSNVSVGTANNALNSVYNAQSNLNNVASRYGTDSNQFKEASSQLSSVRQDAVKAGLDSKLVNDTGAVSSAHSALNKDTASVMAGTWKPVQQTNNSSSTSRGITL